jgi:4-hydroxy-2-oxoheptanedioate aldolase
MMGAMLSEYARPSVVKLFQHAGYDFIYVEYEHGFFGLDRLTDTIISARDNGLPVVAKTPQLERQEIAKLLEAGVVGIQLPRTETREEVETLIDYVKHPPLGTRAIAPGWASSDYQGVSDWSAWMEEQSAETSIVLHIETRKAYANFAEIVKTPGIDMVYAGPGDSSVELGHPGDFDHPEVRGPMEGVLKLCLDNGIAFGTTAANVESAADWVEKGALFFEVGSDLDFIRQGATQLIRSHRDAFGKKR